MTSSSRVRDAYSALSDDIDSIPYTVGWTRAAIALHSIGLIETPILVRLSADAHPPLLVDFRYHAFAWAIDLAGFPTEPIEVHVQTEATSNDAAAQFDLPGRDLDDLLWLIGYNSFAGMPASWLRPDERYELVRWPGFSGHNQTLNQMRMTAMLGNVVLSVAELAVAADVDVVEAQRVVNAFTLMGVARGSGDRSATPDIEKRVAFGQLAG